MPRNPPTDRISASTAVFFIAISVISPTVSFFWLVTERPFSLDVNISSLATVENFASAGAVPVVLWSSAANTGLASTASDVAISANFFIVSSSEAIVLLLNARTEQLFRWKIEVTSGSCAGLVVEQPEQRLGRILWTQRGHSHDGLVPLGASSGRGVTHHGRKPSRDRMRIAQVRVGEYHDHGTIRPRGAEVHFAHQTADDARAVELRARLFRIEGEA